MLKEIKEIIIQEANSIYPRATGTVREKYLLFRNETEF